MSPRQVGRTSPFPVAAAFAARSRTLRAPLAATLALASLVGACSPAALPIERVVTEAPGPEIAIAKLTDVLSPAGLEWLVELRPEALFADASLRAGLAGLFEARRLDQFAEATGIDLRQVPELAIASYRGKDGTSTLVVLARHRGDARGLERKFRTRLTGDEQRTSTTPQLVGVWGTVGRQQRGFATLGARVVGFEYDGDRRRGPLRIAMLFAEGRLPRVSPLGATPEFGSLAAKLDEAPARATFFGPFEGPLAKGARGLLVGTTGAGLALAPTGRSTLDLRLVLEGDLDDPAAPRFLEGAWSDLAGSDLGHLLGLGSPRSGPTVRQVDGGLELTAELDAAALLDGLAAATTADVSAVMR